MELLKINIFESLASNLPAQSNEYIPNVTTLAIIIYLDELCHFEIIAEVRNFFTLGVYDFLNLML